MSLIIIGPSTTGRFVITKTHAGAETCFISKIFTKGIQTLLTIFAFFYSFVNLTTHHWIHYNSIPH